MRVLRLGNSDDTYGTVEAASRAAGIAGRLLEEACGEPVETLTRVIWPAPELPDLIAEWACRHEPDIVMFTATGFWVAYPSAPLKLQRSGSAMGRRLGKLGEKAGANQGLSRNPVARGVRAAVTSAVGGAYYFEPEAVIELAEACFRRILRSERLLLGVRGGSPLRFPAAMGGEAEARRLRLNDGIAGVCAGLRIPFRGFPPEAEVAYLRDLAAGDGVHPGAAGHAIAGAIEGDLLVATYRQGLAEH